MTVLKGLELLFLVKETSIFKRRQNEIFELYILLVIQELLELHGLVRLPKIFFQGKI